VENFLEDFAKRELHQPQGLLGEPPSGVGIDSYVKRPPPGTRNGYEKIKRS
jgi:hypothetical protein